MRRRGGGCEGRMCIERKKGTDCKKEEEAENIQRRAGALAY